MTPRVSIVLPTHNREALLPGALESCLKQTFRDLEVIIVDDGSTDGTATVAARLAAGDPRVKVVTQSNAGLPSALNRGFAEARGEFLTWTSDDNRYHPTAIEAMVENLERNPECGLVYTDFQLVDSEGQVKQKVTSRSPSDLVGINVVGACFLYRRAVADKVGHYNEKLGLVEDWDYWLRLALVAPIRHLKEIHYDFLDHDESLTYRRQLQVLETEFRMRKLTPHPEARKEMYRKLVARRLATLHWEAGNKLKAILFRLKSI
jgi:glycosyltransferase involved in cell wall biosynthesis